jgi:hypothetical protein
MNIKFEPRTVVKFGNSPILGHVIMSNADETLVYFDDGDRCAVSTEFLMEVTV